MLYQCGFRREYSTSRAIIRLVEKVSRSQDTGKIVFFSRLEKTHLIQLLTKFYLINYMHMNYEILFMNGLKVT